MTHDRHLRDIMDIAYRAKFHIKQVEAMLSNDGKYIVKTFQFEVYEEMRFQDMYDDTKLEILDVDRILNYKST